MQVMMSLDASLSDSLISVVFTVGSKDTQANKQAPVRNKINEANEATSFYRSKRGSHNEIALTRSHQFTWRGGQLVTARRFDGQCAAGCVSVGCACVFSLLRSVCLE